MAPSHRAAFALTCAVLASACGAGTEALSSGAGEDALPTEAELSSGLVVSDQGGTRYGGWVGVYRASRGRSRVVATLRNLAAQDRLDAAATRVFYDECYDLSTAAPAAGCSESPRAPFSSPWSFAASAPEQRVRFLSRNTLDFFLDVAATDLGQPRHAQHATALLEPVSTRFRVLSANGAVTQCDLTTTLALESAMALRAADGAAPATLAGTLSGLNQDSLVQGKTDFTLFFSMTRFPELADVRLTVGGQPLWAGGCHAGLCFEPLTRAAQVRELFRGGARLELELPQGRTFAGTVEPQVAPLAASLRCTRP